MKEKKFILRMTAMAVLMGLLLGAAGSALAQQSGNIVFNDPNVKAICVNNWDGILDGITDGELSYTEAAAVTDLGSVFRGDTTITSFDELQYFTGVTRINDSAFVHCHALASVMFPSTLDSIGDYAFDSCDSLTSIQIPQNVKFINSRAFINCWELETLTVESGNNKYSSANNCIIDYLNGKKRVYIGGKNAVIPTDAKILGNNAFRGRNLTNIDIPDGVERIGGSTFAATKLKQISIPSTVTSLGDYTFAQCDSLTSIVIPNSVTSIGHSMFSHCPNLTSVTLSSQLTEIPKGMFYDCLKLEVVNIPDGVTRIDDYAFHYCHNLQAIDLPEGVTYIGTQAFYYCESIKSVTIPSGVTVIPSIAFHKCSSLETLTFAAPSSLETIEHDAFSYCNLKGRLEIPDGVTYIGTAAFHYNYQAPESSLKELVIGASVDSIGFRAFSNHKNIESITVRALTPPAFGVKGYLHSTFNGQAIIDDAFERVNRNIPVYVFCEDEYMSDSEWGTNYFTDYRSMAQDGTITVSVNPNDNAGTVTGDGSYVACDDFTLTAIANPGYAFRNWTTENGRVVSVDNTYTSKMIGDMSFVANFNRTGPINFADTLVKHLCVNAWDGILDGIEDGELTYEEAAAVTDLGKVFAWEIITSFDELQYFTGLTAIGKDAFNYCAILESVTLPNSLTAIRENAFEGCKKLESVTFPNSLDSIGDYAFRDCDSLTSIHIPSSVTHINSRAFMGCGELDIVTVESGNSIYSSVDNCIIDYLNGEKRVYLGGKNAVIPTDAKIIGNNAFRGRNLTNIDIPEGVERIGGSTFAATKLKQISIPSTVTFLGDYTFGQCDSLTYVEIPDNVDSIGIALFKECANLTSVKLSNQLTVIPKEMFFNCPKLQSINIHDGVTEIGIEAFKKCRALASVEFTNNTTLKTIRNYAFDACISLTSVTMPNSVTTIGIAVFDNCESLASVTLSNQLKTLTYCTFRNCRALTSVTLPSTLEIIKEGAFQNCESLPSIDLPSTLKRIEFNNDVFTFQGCNKLTSIHIPSSVESIASKAFMYSHFEQITVDSNNIYYDSRNNCNAIIRNNTLIVGCKNTVIPGDVTSIEANAFRSRPGLTSIKIPNSVTTIKGSAFDGNDSLTSVTIGNSVSTIQNYVFKDCKSLASITIEATTPPTLGGTSVFTNVDKSIPVYVPYGSLNDYKNWGGFTNIQPYFDVAVDGYTSNSDGWHLIASPLLYDVSPEDVEGMLENTYDLYAFDGSKDDKQWRNYKNHSTDEFQVLEGGKGYLYANSDDVVLRYKGKTKEASFYEVTLNPSTSGILGSWNLVGNSYMTEATVSRDDFYRLITQNGISTLVLNDPNNFVVNAMEGIFVQATAGGETVTFTKSTRGASAVASPTVNIDLLNGTGSLLDRARLRMGEGTNLGKLDLMNDPNRLYFRMDGKDYAVAHVNAQGEMPLSFDAAQNGSFTLNVSVEGMEMDYLHLIDNMTGEDVDLLATSTGSVATYTFTGKPGNYASRFRLVFSANGVNDNQEDNNANFAYINGEEIVILNAEANATLQVVDITGRIIVSRDGVHTVSTAGMVPGVYVLRLINGTDVKVQKIVIE